AAVPGAQLQAHVLQALAEGDPLEAEAGRWVLTLHAGRLISRRRSGTKDPARVRGAPFGSSGAGEALELLAQGLDQLEDAGADGQGVRGAQQADLAFPHGAEGLEGAHAAEPALGLRLEIGRAHV